MTNPKDRDPEARDHDPEAGADPGSYLGRKPERVAETIPGGVSRRDERIAAHSTQSSPSGGDPLPNGHRQGRPVTADTTREAGQDR